MTKKKTGRGKLTPEAEAKLREIWDRLPKIDCQGFCWDSCGPIQLTRLEHKLTQRAGVTIEDSSYYQGGAALCVALTEPYKRCAVYDDRPTICRLWGLTDGMRCNYGCVPEGGHISDRDAYHLIADVLELDGNLAAAEQLRYLWNDENAPKSRLLLLERQRSDDVARSRRVARAEANGTALYATGRGQLSKTPPAGHR
jgi:Fe-S-cluster containining protein